MFPRGYNTSKISDEVVPHTQMKSLFDQGIMVTETIDGNKVKLYSLERTLAEILRSRNYVDPEIITNVYKQWAKSKKKDLNQLGIFCSKI